MVLINIAAMVVAVAVVVLVAYLVPLIRELRITAVSLRELAVKMETEIEPTIKELNRTLADVNAITTFAAHKTEDIQTFMAAVGNTGRGLKTISSLVSGTAEAFTKSALWVTGAKAAGSFILDRFQKKGGS